MSSTAFTWLPVAFGLTGDFLVNFVGWAVSSYLKSDLLYDLLGAASHVLCVILALVGATQSGLLTTRVSFAAALIGLWANWGWLCTGAQAVAALPIMPQCFLPPSSA